MVRTNIESGLVIYWSLTRWSSRSRLKDLWGEAGYSQYVPEPRPNISCLRDALNEVFGGSRHLVRRLATRTGFTVVHEERGENENAYRPFLTAKCLGEHSEPIFTGDTSKADEVLAAYRLHAGRIEAPQLAGAMVKIVSDLGGTRLRPTGGIYWLPGRRTVEWERVTEAIEAAADDGKSVCYSISHDLDEKAIFAVQDAIIQEVTSEAKRLYEEIHSGDIGERAIQSRKREAGTLRKKVAEYEALLGVGLDNLRTALDRVDQTNAVASLLLAADPFSQTEEAASGCTV